MNLWIMVNACTFLKAILLGFLYVDDNLAEISSLF